MVCLHSQPGVLGPQHCSRGQEQLAAAQAQLRAAYHSLFKALSHSRADVLHTHNLSHSRADVLHTHKCSMLALKADGAEGAECKE